MSGGTPAVRELLGTATGHGVLLTEGSLIYDTRDSEVSPHEGQYHQAKLRYSPSLSQHLPYQYAQLNLTSRLYMSVVPERLRFAARVVVDWQFGDVPFYELARYEDTFAFGGANGIRGIQANATMAAPNLLQLRAEVAPVRLHLLQEALHLR